MATFSASTSAEAVVPVSRDRVWAVLTDPDAVARLTPFLTGITAHTDERGDDAPLWRWTMTRIPVLGTAVDPEFTERMELTPTTRIDFHHEPPAGADERTGVEGSYTLADADVSEVTDGRAEGATEATRLQTELTITVDLPLPKLSGPAVRTAMKGVMASMGSRFASRLLDELGVG